MDVLPVNFMPGDPILIDKIVYELKSRGIFDSFRKECIADVDTKPAYQNLRQRVEGNVTGFLKNQIWNPDMNKNQVREQLRKAIYESGFLETGVERIVDQVVNPKMSSIFLPKVTEVVYEYLGIQKPTCIPNYDLNKSAENLLPRDLEAVSPDSGPFEKQDKSFHSLDDSKVEEDESPPFEPIEEQTMHEENSVDSNLSGFSGLLSHDSNHSTGNRLQIDMDTQMSKQSSDLSNQNDDVKMDISEDSRHDSNSKSCDIDSSDKSSSSTKFDKKDDKSDLEKRIDGMELEKKVERMELEKKVEKPENEKMIVDKTEDDKKSRDRHRSSDKHRSRTESRSDKKSDRKDRDKYSSKNKDRKDSTSSRKDSRSSSSRNDKDRHRSSSSRHSSSHDKSSSSSSSKRESTSSKDKKDKKDHSRDKSKDTKPKDDKKSTSSSHPKSDRKSSSSSSHHDKDKRDSKKRSSRKDDHFSSKLKSERRSTDRDSNDGSGLKSSSSSYCESNSSSQNSQTNKTQDNNNFNSNESGNSDAHETKRVVVNSEDLQNFGELVFSSSVQEKRIILPKIASNIHEARRLMKIRKQLRKIEKQSSIALDALNAKHLEQEQKIEESKEELLKPRMQVSMATWDALEAKLNESMNFDTYYDPELADKDDEHTVKDSQESNASKIEGINVLRRILSDDSKLDHKVEIESAEINKVDKLEIKLGKEDVSELEVAAKEKAEIENAQLVGVQKDEEEMTDCNKDEEFNLKSTTKEEDVLNEVAQNEELESLQITNVEDTKLIEIDNQRAEFTKPNVIEKDDLNDVIKEVESKEVVNIEDIKEESRIKVCDESELKEVHEEVHGEMKEADEIENFGLPQTREIILEDEASSNVTDIIEDAKLNQEILNEEVQSNQNEENVINPNITAEVEFMGFSQDRIAKDEALFKIISGEVTRCEKEMQEMQAILELSILNNIPTAVPKNKNVGIKRQLSENTENIKKLKNNNNVFSGHHEHFALPLSPAESDKSTGKKADLDIVLLETKQKRQSNKRYSSDDLYKPRPVIKRTSARSRGAKID